MKLLNRRARLSIISAGETDAIGERNCLLLTYGRDGILLDCGQKVPIEPTNEGGELPPEYYPDFSKMSGINILGVLVSHCHLDHIGGLEKFTKLYPNSPIITAPFTLEIIRGKLLNSRSGGLHWDTESSVELGPFTIRRFPVLHSVPASSGFLVSVGGKNIFYTGDIKIPGDYMPRYAHGSYAEYLREKYERYEGALREVGSLGVDVMIHDATNISEPGFAGIEERVYPEIETIIRGHRGRVFVSVISSNLWRIRNIIRIAEIRRRRVYVAGAAIKDFLRLSRVDGWKSLDKHSVSSMPRDAVIIVSGSQGEPGSFLDKLFRGNLDFDLEISDRDSLVNSSDTIPIPEIESRSKEMLEGFSSMFGTICLTYDTPQIRSYGAHIERVEGLHVSGHGKQGDTGRELELVRPKLIIPFHADLERRRAMTKFAHSQFGIEGLLLEKDGILNL